MTVRMFTKVAIICAILVVVNAGALLHNVALTHTGKSVNSRQQDAHGNYAFGYDIVGAQGARNSRSDVGDAHGNRKGSYTLHGINRSARKVDYIVDGYGFRTVVKTNEPRTAFSAPATAVIASPYAGHVATVVKHVAPVAHIAPLAVAHAAPSVVVPFAYSVPFYFVRTAPVSVAHATKVVPVAEAHTAPPAVAHTTPAAVEHVATVTVAASTAHTTPSTVEDVSHAAPVSPYAVPAPPCPCEARKTTISPLKRRMDHPYKTVGHGLHRYQLGGRTHGQKTV